LAIDVLMADCTRRSLRAAAEKLPCSTTVTNARSWSRVIGSYTRQPSHYLMMIVNRSPVASMVTGTMM
jgi:hypothetical protein